MSEHPIKSVIDSLLDGIKSVADVDTVIGKPVETPDGTVIIPVSKVSLGFGVGGSDIKGISSASDGSNLFGGGSGGGMKLEPVAFLVISNGNVELLKLASGSDVSALIPGVVEFVQNLVQKRKNKNTEE